MDISKEYILMCRQSKEMQKNYNPVHGDFVFYMGSTDIEDMVVCGGPEHMGSDSLHPWTHYCNCFDTPMDELMKSKEHPTVWLPRQDQLQDMLEDCLGLLFWDLCNEPEGWLCMGRDVGEQTIYPRKENFIKEEDMSKTAEQALLKMLMSQEYDKKWNGKGWVKEDVS